MNKWAVTVILLLCAPRAVQAGSYINISKCSADGGCLLTIPQSQPVGCGGANPPCKGTAFGITHSRGFQGSETNLVIRICLEPADIVLEPALLRAIEIWEALVPKARNCHDCCILEAPAPSTRFFAATLMLHELGHCAMGLAHVNRFWDTDWNGTFEDTSYTRSVEAANQSNALDAGADGIRGSKDDYHMGLGGGAAPSVSWFRRSDNNPFIIDSSPVGTSTFSRNLNNLPDASHSWGASGNRRVGQLLSYPNSQSVMYSVTCGDQYFWGLSADDVNMVKMAMTGQDLEPGGGDDYTIDLQYVGNCTNPHEIRVAMDAAAAGLADCVSWYDYSFSQSPATARHFSVVPDAVLGFTHLQVRFDPTPPAPWDYTIVLFIGDAEAGDLGDWSSTFP